MFNIQKERVKYVTTMEFASNMYHSDANCSAVALLLKKENIGFAQQYIDYVLEHNPKNIHAWCNRGVYLLQQRPPGYEEAEKAAEKMRQLMEDNEAMVDAKIETAYWWYSRCRSDKNKSDALKIFEELLLDKTEDHNYSHHYFYLKTLFYELKATTDVENQRELLEKMVQQLIILASSKDAQFELEVWTYLATIRHKSVRVKTFEVDGFKQLQQQLGCIRLDLQLCTEKMKDILEKNRELRVYSNVYSQLGTNYLELSFATDEKEKTLNFLEKALQYGEKYLSKSASHYENAPRLCARVLLNIWAIKYYEEHTDEVDKYIEERNRPHSVFIASKKHVCKQVLLLPLKN